jgi:hypothetical protein
VERRALIGGGRAGRRWLTGRTASAWDPGGSGTVLASRVGSGIAEWVGFGSGPLRISNRFRKWIKYFSFHHRIGIKLLEITRCL